MSFEKEGRGACSFSADKINEQTEINLEPIRHLIDNKEKEIKKMVDLEFSLLKFELLQGAVSRKEREKANKAVTGYREEKWEKAMKLAKGDETKAEIIYDQI